MMELLKEEEWVLAMVTKEDFALGKSAQRKETHEIEEMVTREK